MKEVAVNRPKYRCFAPELEEESQFIDLSIDESHHLIKVLRAAPQEKVSLFNGKGLEAIGVLLNTSPKKVNLKIERISKNKRPIPEIVLVQAIPKGKTMDTVIRQSCELGVTKIVPLITDHTEIRVDEKREIAKLQKWRQIAIEACKQACNSFVPVVLEPMRFMDFILGLSNEYVFVGAIHEKSVPALNAIEQLSTNWSKETDPIYIMIGPEGDFSKAEYEKMDKQEFIFFSLGRFVLKVDTATIVSLFTIRAGIQNYLDDSKN
jgi:16S rRNA (uracil1498-N3)-methyltransferase